MGESTKTRSSANKSPQSPPSWFPHANAPRGKTIQLPTLSASAYVTMCDVDFTRCEAVVLHDTMGIEGSSIRWVCDGLANRLKARVVCPDLFVSGDKPPSRNSMLSTPLLWTWLKRQRYASLLGIVQAAIDWLDLSRNEANSNCDGCSDGEPQPFVHRLPLIVVAFSFGGWLALRLSTLEELDSMEQSLIERIGAFVICHPAIQFEFALNCSSSSQYRLLRMQAAKPMLCFASWDDPPTLKPGGLLEKALNKNGVDGRCVHLDTTKHGWMTRGEWRTDKELRRTFIVVMDMTATFLETELDLARLDRQWRTSARMCGWSIRTEHSERCSPLCRSNTTINAEDDDDDDDDNDDDDDDGNDLLVVDLFKIDASDTHSPLFDTSDDGPFNSETDCGCWNIS